MNDRFPSDALLDFHQRGLIISSRLLRNSNTMERDFSNTHKRTNCAGRKIGAQHNALHTLP
jgi:hypothetical protein